MTTTLAWYPLQNTKKTFLNGIQSQFEGKWMNMQIDKKNHAHKNISWFLSIFFGRWGDNFNIHN
jgi:hypothetical protein